MPVIYWGGADHTSVTLEGRNIINGPNEHLGILNTGNIMLYTISQYNFMQNAITCVEITYSFKYYRQITRKGKHNCFNVTADFSYFLLFLPFLKIDRRN